MNGVDSHAEYYYTVGIDLREGDKPAVMDGPLAKKYFARMPASRLGDSNNKVEKSLQVEIRRVVSDICRDTFRSTTMWFKLSDNFPGGWNVAKGVIIRSIQKYLNIRRRRYQILPIRKWN